MLRPSQWDADAEVWARKLPTDEPGGNFHWLRSQVTSGAAKIATLTKDGEAIGFVVFKIEGDAELHILAAFGHDRTNLIEILAPLTDQLARRCDCETVRFHTMRPGLIARAQDHGFRVVEVMMRKRVN